MLSLLNFLLYSLLPFLFILGFCVTIHEFGHFIIAKLFHIPVEKFSIGYGPPIFRKTIGETDFRIAYFPLGGYVKMAGEEEGEILKEKMTILDKQKNMVTLPSEDEEELDNQGNSNIKDEETSKQLGFYDVAIYKRVLVVFSGPLFNIVSATAVLVIVFSIFGIVVTPYMRVEVEKSNIAERAGILTNDSIIAINGQQVKNWEDFLDIAEKNQNREVTLKVKRDNADVEIQLPLNIDSLGIKPLVPSILGSLKIDGPAYEAGMKKGDRVIRIDDQEIKTWDKMVEIVRESRNEPLQFTWQHENEVMTAQITPVSFYDPLANDTIGQIGVFIPHGRKFLPIHRAFTLSIRRTGEMVYRILEVFYFLITRKIPIRQIGGPIAIFKLSTESAQWGFENLLGLLVIISINLGLINLFPIPALDGGHIIIAVIEGIRRKRFSRQTRIIIQQIGYAIILLLIVFVTFNDITR